MTAGKLIGVNAIERKRPQITAGKNGNGVHQKVPSMNPKGGKGVCGVRRQIPRVDAMCDTKANNCDDLVLWFQELQARLRRVRVACGDWKRVLGSTPLGLTSNVPPGFITAVVLDPPYAYALRDPEIYAHDSGTVSADVRKWALDHGDDDRLRIVLCGYEGEHAMPDTWGCVTWKAAGGYGNRTGNRNAHLERLWFSPHCLKPDRGELPLVFE